MKSFHHHGGPVRPEDLASEADGVNVALQGALVLGLVEFPGGQFAGGAVEPFGDGVVGGGRGDGGEGFAVEGVAWRR